MSQKNDYNALEIFVRSVSDLTDEIDRLSQLFNSFFFAYRLALRPKTTASEMAHAATIRNSLLQMKSEIENNPVVIEIAG